VSQDLSKSDFKAESLEDVIPELDSPILKDPTLLEFGFDTVQTTVESERRLLFDNYLTKTGSELDDLLNSNGSLPAKINLSLVLRSQTADAEVGRNL